MKDDKQVYSERMDWIWKCPWRTEMTSGGGCRVFELATCGELADLSAYGVKHNKCVGDELIVRLFHDDAKLKDYASGVPI